MKAVIKKEDGHNGIVFNIRQLDLRFRIVVQKLRDVRHEDIHAAAQAFKTNTLKQYHCFLRIHIYIYIYLYTCI